MTSTLERPATTTGIRYERVTVTPGMARKWLGNNAENNRFPKKSKIPGYARDMAAGNWQLTGETIKFDPTGTLIDGQNRLHAVILADTPVAFDVAYDVPGEAMQVIDTGSARTFADVLIIGNSPNRMNSASIVRWLIAWDAGTYRGPSNGYIAPTHSEMMNLYTADPGLYDAAAARANDCRQRGLGTASAIGTAYVLFHRLSRPQTHEFFDHFITGANLPDRHPVLVLRNRMVRVRTDRTTRPEQLALLIRGWNAFREDRLVDRLHVTRTGELTNANFPQPK